MTNDKPQGTAKRAVDETEAATLKRGRGCPPQYPFAGTD